MRSFAELLREYTARTGVSDAELARAVGVQRQTVFRWKEGSVARPRAAEDVVRLAHKLRLSREERDELLLAAGFPPLEATARDLRLHAGPTLGAKGERDPGDVRPDAALAPDGREDAEDAVAHAPSEAPVPAARTRSMRRVGPLLLIAGLVAVALLAWAILRPRGEYPVAAAGETLIVVGQFANYTGGDQGFNVSGRIRDALEREISGGRLNVRVAEWPEPVRETGTVVEVAALSGAALIIWGEYDSGRILARFSMPAGAGVPISTPRNKTLQSRN
jgi:hypothetical protein